MTEQRHGMARSLEGQLLVASPYVANSHFARTVVLVLQDQQNGTVGVILNRRLPVASHEVWRQIGVRGPAEDFPTGDGESPAGSPPFAEASVFLGGPLAGPVLGLHQDESLSEHRLGRKLFVAATVAKLGQLADGSHGPLRLFVGHAGWSAEQIDRELRQGVWMVLPAHERLVFDDNIDLWATSVRRVGRQVLEASLPARTFDFPHDWN